MGNARKISPRLTKDQHPAGRVSLTRDFWRPLLIFSFVWTVAALLWFSSGAALLKESDSVDAASARSHDFLDANGEVRNKDCRPTHPFHHADSSSLGTSTIKPEPCSAVDAQRQKSTLRRMDSVEIARQVLVGIDRASLRGNLTKFTDLHAHFFDAKASSEGVHLFLNLSAQGVSDISLRNASTEVPPYDLGNELAAQSVDRTSVFTIFGRAGYIYKRRPSARLSSYDVVKPASMNPFRHANLARLPAKCASASDSSRPPWLIDLRNVWMGTSGEIFVPERVVQRSGATDWIVREYQFQSGCCEQSWPLSKGRKMVFRQPRGQPSRAKVGFSLSQHHGSTYYHVSNQALPRLLSFWDVALAVMALPGGKIVGPGHPDVLVTFLRNFGIPDSKLLLFAKGRKAPIFFERLFVPGPFHLRLDSYSHDCVVRGVGRIVGAHSLQSGGREPPKETVPLVVLLERARSRSPDGKRCRGVRCLANFGALRRAIATEFGDRVRVEVLSGKDPDVLLRAIRLFARATIVVGVHGAGMSNILFMRGRGTFCIHLGWEGMWPLYGRIAHTFDVDFVNILTQGASQDGENVVADIPVVVLAMRNFLKKQNVTLDPPRIPTNATRLALASLRLPDLVKGKGKTR